MPEALRPGGVYSLDIINPAIKIAGLIGGASSARLIAV
jgi:hypothetical protein